jgi:hypothetical protein
MREGIHPVLKDPLPRHSSGTCHTNRGWALVQDNTYLKVLLKINKYFDIISWLCNEFTLKCLSEVSKEELCVRRRGGVDFWTGGWAGIFSTPIPDRLHSTHNFVTNWTVCFNLGINENGTYSIDKTLI